MFIKGKYKIELLAGGCHDGGSKKYPLEGLLQQKMKMNFFRDLA